MNTTPTTLPPTTDVLIVGAGPTGLALATSLCRAGIRPLLLDRLAAGQGTSRAAVLHAHTLEMLEQIDVTPDLVRDGLTLTHFSLRDRDRSLLRLDFHSLPSRHASLLMLPQERTEHHLTAALHRAGGEAHRSCTVTALCETATGVQAAVETPSGHQTVCARYVVGADGMHSLVRQVAGIGFTGSSYEESFVLADVDMDWSHGREEVMLFLAPSGLVVVAPLPGNRFRIVATVPDAPSEPGVADVQALLDGRGPRHGHATVQAVHWSSRFRLHHRVADRYRRGPYLLIGDAAHVHSPAGGQGMNTGLVDALVLGRLLADHLHGTHDEHRLDLYERLRRPAAKRVLALTGRMTSMATMRHPLQRVVRNLILRTVGSMPTFRRRLMADLSGLSRRAAAVVPDT